jgi:SAM-dependent methyltransferase
MYGRAKPTPITSTQYWDEAARNNAAWHVATSHSVESGAFFQQGGSETESFLQFCDIRPSRGHSILEIGCGVGRMTRRLAELFGHVVAVDISAEMLKRCQENLAAFDNVTYGLVSGDGTLTGLENQSLDAVFSYITLQHVPRQRAQLWYLSESARVLRSGGRLGIQVRSAARSSVFLEYAAHLTHALGGRDTSDPSWRGTSLKAPTIIRELRDCNVEGEILVWPHHHLWNSQHWWVTGTKT